MKDDPSLVSASECGTTKGRKFPGDHEEALVMFRVLIGPEVNQAHAPQPGSIPKAADPALAGHPVNLVDSCGPYRPSGS